MNSYNESNLESLARILGSPQGLQPEPFQRPVAPTELRRFLSTKDGQVAARAAVEQVIATQGQNPQPPYEAIINTLKSQITGGGV